MRTGQKGRPRLAGERVIWQHSSEACKQASSTAGCSGVASSAARRWQTDVRKRLARRATAGGGHGKRARSAARRRERRAAFVAAELLTTGARVWRFRTLRPWHVARAHVAAGIKYPAMLAHRLRAWTDSSPAPNRTQFDRLAERPSSGRNFWNSRPPAHTAPHQLFARRGGAISMSLQLERCRPPMRWSAR